jgi:hypothetical protein
MVYECPEEIFSLFDSPHSVERGREAVTTWLRALPLKPGDMVWTPEHGWLMKEDYGPH